MSTGEQDITRLSAEIDAVDRRVPVQPEFQKLELMSDGALDEDPELTVLYHPDDEKMDAWYRFESKLLVDLKEVR